MSSLTPKTYVMALTAQEIEQRLLSIDNLLPKSVIKQSLSNPAVDTVPSTQAVVDALSPIQNSISGLGGLADNDSVSLDSVETSGVLPIAKGGTGGMSLGDAQSNLGILTQTEIQTLINNSIPTIQQVWLDSAQVKGILPVSKGGTGSNSPSEALKNLGIHDSNGKVPVAQLPAVAITDTFPVNSQSAMLALDAQVGDVAIRSDISKSFILMQEPANVLANWKELLNDAEVKLTPQIRESLRRSYALDSLTLVEGSFEKGATLSSATDVLLFEVRGKSYSWGGTFPKVVPPDSTPDSTGGVGAGGWVSRFDPILQDTVGALGVRVAAIEDKSVDTIAALRLINPSAVGEVVYVRSSIATPFGVYGYFGGGYFTAYDNTQANIDDGGVFIDSPHATLDWQRINFTHYDMRFWGLIADLPSFDNAETITKATNFAKARKVLLYAPVGSIYTSEMVPVYDNMGITGHGSAEQTVFYKTTNNPFPYKANGNTVFTVDALVGFVPKKSIAGGSMVDGETHTARPHLSKCMFRRNGLTDLNYAVTRPAVGFFVGSMAGGLISDVTVEGGYIGVQGWTCYLASMERVFVNNFPGKGFIAFTFSAYSAAPVGFKTSGTSLDMRLVNGRGYQIGFEMVGQQYTSMTCCTVEECEPMAGETTAIAFKFINPYAITMDACATEGVKGTQLQVTNGNPASYKSSLLVQNYIAIGQRNPQTAGTKFIEIDNGAIGTLNVTFIGGDLTRDTGLSNLTAGTVSGTNTKAIKIGAGGLVLAAVNSGVFVDLA